MEEIELRTEDVNELLTVVPKWIIRWGITMIFLVMVSILVLSVYIRYPDTLMAAATITTTNPPVTLISKTNGKIAELNVKNNQPVKQGDILLVIENTAHYVHVQKIARLLDTITINSGAKGVLSVLTYDSLQMGELTPPFLQFLKSYSDYQLYNEVNPQQREIEIINKELGEYQALQSKYQTQEGIYKEEFNLVEKDYNRYNALFQDQSISAKEFEDKKRDYLSAKRNYENIKISNINNKLAINNLEKNKLQLQILAYQENEKYQQGLSQNIQVLKSQIRNWEQTYLIKAPVDGTVSLFNYWTINQNLRQGDEVLSIIPFKKQEIIARLVLPVRNSGKIKTGQVVNIKLNNYAYQQYGILKGFVKTVSIMPQKENYSIEVSLPDKLRTSYKKELDYKEEMQGSADIITEELSVLDRVFYQFRKLMR